MQQNFYAVRDKSIVSLDGTGNHFNESIVAVFQDENDANAFEKAVRPKSAVTIYSKDELIEKYRTLPYRREDA